MARREGAAGRGCSSWAELGAEQSKGCRAAGAGTGRAAAAGKTCAGAGNGVKLTGNRVIRGRE